MRMELTGRAGRALLLAVCLLLAGASTAAAQAYQWQDEHGQIHFTDNPGEIPARFRKQVKQHEMPEPVRRSTPRSSSGSADSSTTGIMTQAIDDAIRVQWPDVPAPKRKEAVATILERMPVLILALVVHSIATLAMFGHAVASKRPLWAVANLLVIFAPPLYTFLKLESPAFPKILLLVAWATGPAAGISLHLALARVVA